MADDDNVIRVQFGAAAAPQPAEPPPAGNDEKLGVFSDMVERGTVLVTLDARREDVTVPPQFRGELRLNLNFCHMFGIPDFEYDEWGVRASLSFGGVDFYCDIPWTAVYMMRSHVENDVMLFSQSIPPEMMAFVQQAMAHEAEGEEE